MESSKYTPRQLLSEIYRLEKGISARIVASYIKCVEIGLVDHGSAYVADDRRSLETYVRRLLHEGLAVGWIYEQSGEYDDADADTEPMN